MATTASAGRKGQHSWNISVTKEARMDTKVVLNRRLNALFGEYFFARKKNRLNKRTYFKMILQALLLVTKQAEPIKGLLTVVHSFV